MLWLLDPNIIYLVGDRPTLVYVIGLLSKINLSRLQTSFWIYIYVKSVLWCKEIEIRARFQYCGWPLEWKFIYYFLISIFISLAISFYFTTICSSSQTSCHEVFKWIKNFCSEDSCTILFMFCMSSCHH